VPEAEPLVGQWRRLHTQVGGEGMPAHITLLYPFMDSSFLTGAVNQRLQRVLSQFEPVDVDLRSSAYFEGGDENVLYLVPDPEEPFVAITDALAYAFPEHPPYGGVFAEVIPHLTVAGSTDRALLAGIEEEVEPRLPIRAAVSEARLMERAPQGWRLRQVFPLGA
jgi:2'-5' RNA ligase superfamily protein